MSVRSSTKSFFDFNVGRGAQYDPIQGQGHGHGPWKLEIRPFSEAISSPVYKGGWQMTTRS